MQDCIFCKLASGEVPCMKVYEDEHTFSMMDIAGDVDGHILVIPKKHCVSILDYDYDILEHMARTVKKVSKHLVDACGYDGVDLMSPNGEAAGQTIPHFHIHIIPRGQNDGLGGSGAQNEILAMHQKLKME